MRSFSLRHGVFAICLSGLCVTAVLAQFNNNLPTSPTDRNQGATDPRNRARIHTELGAMYFQSGSMSVALDELGIALAADSNYFQAYSIRGLVYAALKEYGKAENDFQRALNLAPNDPEVNNNYGWYLCDTGKERQSIAYFLNALKSPLYETPERAYTNAGTCALKAGDLEGAQGYLLQALQISRDGGMTARFQMAKLLHKRGTFEEARLYLADVLKMMEPPTAEALWLGVRIERKLGNRVAEGGYASQLRGRYPASPEYQEFLKGNFE
ncbi:MAG TPA: type IV pilus biogenesis/stability protein PilW [Azonexus sp.]|nr:type IV pilus biogenesis/stability protein PilW [Azonexus sp.]